MTQFSPNRKVFIDLLRGQLAQGDITVNRKALVEFLDRQKLLTIAHNFIGSFEESDKAYWTEVLLSYARQSLHLSSILINILAELRTTGIDPVPLKGPVLAQRLYGDVSRRHSGDLDLLVGQDELMPAIESLSKLGYKLVSPKPGLSQKQTDYFFRHKNEYCIYSEKYGLYVELHIGVYNRGLLKTEDGQLFFQHLIPGEFGGIPVMEMNVNNSFLYLAYHGGRHQYYRLFWLRDIAEALEKWDLDHQEIFTRAQVMGIDRLLVMSLALSNRIFNSSIPLEYHDYIHNNKIIIEKLSRLCIERFFGPEKLTFRGKLQKQYFLYLLRPGIRSCLLLFTNIFHHWYIRKFLGGQ